MRPLQVGPAEASAPVFQAVPSPPRLASVCPPPLQLFPLQPPFVSTSASCGLPAVQRSCCRSIAAGQTRGLERPAGVEQASQNRQDAAQQQQQQQAALVSDTFWCFATEFPKLPQPLVCRLTWTEPPAQPLQPCILSCCASAIFPPLLPAIFLLTCTTFPAMF